MELFSEVEIPHCHGETIHKEMSEIRNNKMKIRRMKNT